MAEHKNAIALLKDQKERVERLRERRTRLAGALGAKKQQLEDACTESVREFQTDDADKLDEIGKQADATNDELVMTLVMELDDIEEQLAALEKHVAA